jgi:DNA-binding MarR family transcriptional regulator
MRFHGIDGLPSVRDDPPRPLDDRPSARDRLLTGPDDPHAADVDTDGHPSLLALDPDDPFDPDLESIAASIGAIRRRGGRRAAARAAELRPAEYAVADVVDLVAARGHLAVTDVAEQLALARSRASTLTSRARRLGWLTGEPGEWDQRYTILSVTDAGRDVVELMQADRRVAVDRATMLWHADDRASLARLLARFVDDLELPRDW